MTSRSEIVSFDGRSKPANDKPSLDRHMIESFLSVVGDRVRNARARRGISRKVLAQMSGVSERYLAQLETGTGNISIVLLLKIATALDLPIDWLIANHDPWADESMTMTSLFQTATKNQRDQVMEILKYDQPDKLRANRIALVGMRGAGKSTLGRLAGEETGMTFLGLGEDIEQAAGMPVEEVFALYGQEGYRTLEMQSLERIAATHDELILEVAGGIVSEPENFNYLLTNYHTVWIRAEAEDHMERVRGQGDKRPMSGMQNAMTQLRIILSSREELYARCIDQVDTSNAAQSQSLKLLVDIVNTRIVRKTRLEPRQI
jgi:XRE family aerobic/anaerobic benzoate catabolism transcriptional regulator